jgi:hypothetical protein
MSPEVKTYALCATCVRITYTPQTFHDSPPSDEPEVQRTNISQLTVSAGGVRESICDARLVKEGVKQYAFHYANNGQRVQIYDSKGNRGIAKDAPAQARNYLASVLTPYTAIPLNRFMSRTQPSLTARLGNARVTSQVPGMVAGRGSVTLEGEYADSDPERYFSVVVVPELNYAVTELKEYDGGKRLLTEFRAADHLRVAEDLVVPQLVDLTKYKYDDQQGGSVQRFRLQVLDAKTEPVGPGTFSLVMPQGADIYDASAPIDVRPLEWDTKNTIRSSIESIGTVERDPKGKTLVAAAQGAIRRHNSAGTASTQLSMAMPNAPWRPVRWVVGIVVTGAVLAVGVAVAQRRKLRSRLAMRDGPAIPGSTPAAAAQDNSGSA